MIPVATAASAASATPSVLVLPALICTRTLTGWQGIEHQDWFVSERLVSLVTDFARTGSSERSHLLRRGALETLMSFCLGDASLGRRKRRWQGQRAGVQGDAEPSAASANQGYRLPPTSISVSGRKGGDEAAPAVGAVTAASAGRLGGGEGESSTRRRAGVAMAAEVGADDASRASGYRFVGKELRQVREGVRSPLLMGGGNRWP